MKLSYQSNSAIMWTTLRNSEEVLNQFISVKWVIGHWGWCAAIWKENSLRLQCRDQLVIRLIANKCYEYTFHFLFFLPLPSSLLIRVVPYVIRFLFAGLVEVVEHRHSLWNYPASLPYTGIRYYPNPFRANNLVDQLLSPLTSTKLLGWVP